METEQAACNTQSQDSDILRSLGKKSEDITGIQWIGFRTIQIDFKNGDRLWLDPRLDVRENSIECYIKTGFIPALGSLMSPPLNETNG